jgi:hypothetical protein
MTAHELRRDKRRYEYRLFVPLSPPAEKATARQEQPGSPAPAMGPGTAVPLDETAAAEISVAYRVHPSTTFFNIVSRSPGFLSTKWWTRPNKSSQHYRHSRQTRTAIVINITSGGGMLPSRQRQNKNTAIASIIPTRPPKCGVGDLRVNACAA